MDTKLIAQCPYCESMNTMIEDDVVYDGKIFFIRRCWKCNQRFVEYNKLVPMSWVGIEEFEAMDDAWWTARAERRNDDGSPGEID